MKNTLTPKSITSPKAWMSVRKALQAFTFILLNAALCPVAAQSDLLPPGRIIELELSQLNKGSIRPEGFLNDEIRFRVDIRIHFSENGALNRTPAFAQAQTGRKNFVLLDQISAFGLAHSAQVHRFNQDEYRVQLRSEHLNTIFRQIPNPEGAALEIVLVREGLIGERTVALHHLPVAQLAQDLKTSISLEKWLEATQVDSRNVRAQFRYQHMKTF